MPSDVEVEQAIPKMAVTSPQTVAETGLNYNGLFKLLLKIIYLRGVETQREIADIIKLPGPVVRELLDDGRERRLVEILGTMDKTTYSSYRFSLTQQGRAWAAEALAQNQYAGPAPVTLDDYRAQVAQQPLTGEWIDRDRLIQQFEGLLVPPTLERRIGPALNSGRSILFYGPPGNGKTTVAEAIAGTFGDTVFVPYAIEAEGELIRMYDPTLHRQVEQPLHRTNPSEPGGANEAGLDASAAGGVDRRWVLCRRPVVGVAGELTMDMLNLSYSPVSGFYDAPMHMKAIGGVFIIDDLGRQLIRPEDLLNRWNVPLERQVDYLTLLSGSTFKISFDALVIFSTNLDPAKLMNAAFLRRIPYKIEMKAPTGEEFSTLFGDLCREYGLTVDADVIAFVEHEIQARHKQPLAFYQPKFIIEQVIAASRYVGHPAILNRELVTEAMENISVLSSVSPSSM